MSLSTVRASTQDGTSGTQVAAIVNENGSGTIQGNALVGSKTTWATVSRTGITAADTATDMSASGFGTSLCDAENAMAIQVDATCSAASATLTGRLVGYDGAGNPIALGDLPAIAITSDATRRASAAGDYLCPRVLADCGRTRKFKFYVESVGAGTWAIKITPI